MERLLPEDLVWVKQLKQYISTNVRLKNIWSLLCLLLILFIVASYSQALLYRQILGQCPPRPPQSRHRLPSGELKAGDLSHWVGWGMGGVSPSQPTRGSAGASWVPQRGPGRTLACNAFLHILKAKGQSILHLYADALSLSDSVLCHIWGVKTEVCGQIVRCPQHRTAPGYSVSTVLYHTTWTNQLVCNLQWGSVWFLKWTDDTDKGQASQRLDVQRICTDIWTVPVRHGRCHISCLYVWWV